MILGPSSFMVDRPFILHPSSFILHPSGLPAFILPAFILPAFILPAAVPARLDPGPALPLFRDALALRGPLRAAAVRLFLEAQRDRGAGLRRREAALGRL
ncbi:MAG: hypothetical protein ACXW5U_22795, partial [Thermoanaerobaculia bacterium]